jgi:hypothetical protein
MSVNNLYGKCKYQTNLNNNNNNDDINEDLREGELESLTDYHPKNLIYKLQKIKTKILEMKYIKNRIG